MCIVQLAHVMCVSLTEFQNSEHLVQNAQYLIRRRYNELPAKATLFSDRPRGTERAKQINSWRGINHLPAETVSAAAFAPNVHKESSRKHNSNTSPVR